ncbi:DPH3 homolog isoform X2 [Labeo rohita]|uniref:DPH3 homolog isoform X2 n=1 Tax=Labeo rohita TaxID=84645 RepID=UPI0021E1D8E0|nr:DPH3 homolog isoform X2 [Labeo rohita]
MVTGDGEGLAGSQCRRRLWCRTDSREEDDNQGPRMREDLESGEEVATCPSCSLIVKVIYDKEQFMCGEVIEAPKTSENKLELAQS